MPYDLTGRGVRPLGELITLAEFPLGDFIPTDALASVFDGLYYAEAQASLQDGNLFIDTWLISSCRRRAVTAASRESSISSMGTRAAPSAGVARHAPSYGPPRNASVPSGTLPTTTRRRKNSVSPSRCGYDSP